MISQWVLAMVLAAPLAAGSPAPTLAWEDIDGVTGSSEQYNDWIVVYTFADRESSDPLMAWQDPANLAVVRRHPELRIAHVNFADVSAVPGIFKGVAEPVIRGINNRAMKRLREVYKEAGLTFDASKARFHLIADWKGKYLKAFGLDDATIYHLWIAVDGKMVAYWNAKSPAVEKEFVTWFDGYAAAATGAAR